MERSTSGRPRRVAPTVQYRERKRFKQIKIRGVYVDLNVNNREKVVETAQTFRKRSAEWKAKRDTCFAFESELCERIKKE